jgi:hypothetical protein
MTDEAAESEGTASPRLMRFQVTSVGPLTRSTFDPAERQDPIEEAVEGALHWSYCTRFQIERFTQNLRQELGALLSTKSRLRQRRRSSDTSYDEHLVFIAAVNLERAVSALPRQLRRQVQTPAVSRQVLRSLRNVYEHWTESRPHYYRAGGRHTKNAPAASKLQKQFPNAEPWTSTFDPKSDDVTLAGVVPLTPLMKELRQFEARLLRFENRLRRGREKDTGS